MNKYVADFETTEHNDRRCVWAWAVCNIPFKGIQQGNSIYSFFEHIRKHPGRYYFHNLKYDGSYIINYLLNHQYTWVLKRNLLRKNTFTTLISNMCVYYSIIVKLDNDTIIEFYDSMKIINMSVEKIAKTFKMPFQKGEIDYNLQRYEGWQISAEELDYIERDVKIVSYALNFFFSQGLTKMTQGSDALYEFKKIIGTKKYNMLFPKLELQVDKDIRKAYRGGFTYLNPVFKGKIIKGKGYVIDYNSLYPSVMYTKKFPYSQPVFFEGQYEYDPNYPLYIQHIRCQFEIKPGYIPTIQIKNNPSYVMNEYITNSGTENPDLFLTNVDLCLFFEHYKTYNLEFINGWKFRAKNDIFKEYIEKWSKEKIKAKEEGNSGMAQISKIFLNSLYGKFGTNPIGKSNKPYLDNDILKYERLPDEERTGGYIPMACFITAYARNETIRAAQKIYETGKYIYSDTDSIHALGDIPEFIPLHPRNLCCWKKEFEIEYCKYLRQKCYVDYGREEPGQRLQRHIVVAAMPKECKKRFSIKQFKLGKEYGTRLKSRQVKGGVDLVEEPFKLLG